MNRITTLVIFTALFISLCLQHTHGSLFQQLSTQRIKPFRIMANGQIIHNPVHITLNSLSDLAELGSFGGFRRATNYIHKTPKGVKRVRLVQTYGNYEIFGTSIEAEMNLEENYSGQMYGTIVRNLQKEIPDPKECPRNAREFLTMAIRLNGLDPSDTNIDMEDGRRVVFVSSETNKAAMAYKISYFYKKSHNIMYPVYYFNACTGDLLYNYDQLQTFLPKSTNSDLSDSQDFNDADVDNGTTAEYYNRDMPASSCSISAAGYGGNAKTGRRTYNSEPYCLPVAKVASTCIMNGQYTKAIDNRQSTDRRKTTPASFNCGTGYYDAVNSAYGVANDAFFYAELTAKMFVDKYRLNLITWSPRVVVHYDRNLENAYSDGHDTYYGDGYRTFYPLVNLDVPAHEIAHAITRKNSNLIYRGQSGGMNEAFSDITAIAVKAFVRGTRNLQWTIGAEIMKRSDSALRYMYDPPKDGHSIKSVWAYKNGMGVHSSSGVYNYAFYQMVEKLNMNVFEAYKNFLDANMNKWSQLTNFFNGACGVVQAAYDNGYSYRRVRWAFRRTGIPLLFCWPPALTATVYIGESRDEILVSETRNPILKIDLTEAISNTTVIEIETEDASSVYIKIGKDYEVRRVIKEGYNRLEFGNDKLPYVHVKLSSCSTKDVLVRMIISDPKLKFM